MALQNVASSANWGSLQGRNKTLTTLPLDMGKKFHFKRHTVAERPQSGFDDGTGETGRSKVSRVVRV